MNTLACVPFFDGMDLALRLLRKHRGLTQSEWAEGAEVSLGSVNRYERGRLPEIEPLGKLLVAARADLHDLQDALDEVNNRPPRPRSALAPPDAATLTRLRLAYPSAPAELVAERATLEHELRRALDRVEEIQVELEVHERRRGAGKPADDTYLQDRIRATLAEALRLLHPEWSPERLNEEADRRLKAEVASRSELK